MPTDVGFEVVNVDLVHGVGVQLHYFEVNWLIVIPQKHDEQFEVDEPVLLDELDVGLWFLEVVDLVLDESPDALARLDLELAKFWLNFPHAKIVKQVVLFDVVQFFAELFNVFDVHVINGSPEYIVDQRGLQHDVVYKLCKGFAEVFSVV